MKILETSSQYNQRISMENSYNKCPECGEVNSLSFGFGCGEVKGLFHMKHRLLITKRCPECGCQYQYNTDWK